MELEMSLFFFSIIVGCSKDTTVKISDGEEMYFDSGEYIVDIEPSEPSPEPSSDTGNGSEDQDNDGWSVEYDCDDENPDINPDMEEICDGVDNNCDGMIDEGVTNLYFLDADGDGFGVDSDFIEACERIDGYSIEFSDCDDTNPLMFPDMEEICDSIDNNCDGMIDEGVLELLFVDADGDGVGVEDVFVEGCSDGNGYSYIFGDCDDSDIDIFPNAEEICDGIDNNCDAQIDEGVLELFFVDNDHDGHGYPSEIIESCFAPYGFSALFDDCDDNDSDTFPTANEICDEVDNNCDGMIDEGVTELFFVDLDEDGFGDLEKPTENCHLEAGIADNFDDCDDFNAHINPDGIEICDEVDNNCDAMIDEGVQDIFYEDIDGDSFGNPDVQEFACSLPTGFVINFDDCDDGNNLIHPEGIEICDEVDNNCDAIVDEDIDEGPVWYRDQDNDGEGHESEMHFACLQPEGYVQNNIDCDDNNENVFSTQQETCDGVDENCDNLIDNEPIDEFTWYFDGDGDGYGTTEQIRYGCEQPDNFTLQDGDCDDQDNDIAPLAEEYCNGEDDNCNEEIDEQSIDQSDWYIDVDGDGFGDDNVSLLHCTQPEGYVQNNVDCDDSLETGSSIFPNGNEVCDGVDNDCDDQIDEQGGTDTPVWFQDADNDGFGTISVVWTSCQAPEGYVDNFNDCDDETSEVSPNATEICDGIDNNCDNAIDLGDATDAFQWYFDGDGDGYGNEDRMQRACEQPTDYVAQTGDCDDQDNDIFEGAPEICNDEDDDCDQLIDETAEEDPIHPTINLINFYQDADADSFGNSLVSKQSCSILDGYVFNNTDCDDSIEDKNADDIADGFVIHPLATEICDEIDNNCDGQIDNGASDASIWYLDSDGDSFGNSDIFELKCSKPLGYITKNGDCDDDDIDIFPDADDIWYDGVDQNCDGRNDFDQDQDGLVSAVYGGDDCNDLDALLGENCEFGTGSDGDLLVSTTGVVVNDYISVSNSISSGTQNITLSDTSVFSSGDEILLIQMQGATQAGSYEFHVISDVNASSITLQDSIAEDYVASSAIQIVRVPNYNQVEVTSGGSIVASDWNGSVGGIVAFRAATTLTVDGTISVSHKGYRGGIALNNTSYWNGYTGESLVPSYQPGNNSNSFGGGGSSYCACGEAAGAGGYGSSGGSPSGSSCSGQEHGQAGSTYGTIDLSTLYFGSGGGGGCRDDTSCEYTVGRDGGGIVFVAASHLTINGSIVSNGENASGGSDSTCDDTIGGAGAGGSIYLIAETAILNSASISAQGGGSTYISQSGVTTGVGGNGRIRVDFSTINNENFGSNSATTALQEACIPDAGYSELYVP